VIAFTLPFEVFRTAGGTYVKGFGLGAFCHRLFGWKCLLGAALYVFLAGTEGMIGEKAG
jgi:hypothetical protein